MVRTEVEILASVGGFSVVFGGHLDNKNIQERNCTIWFYFHGELDGRLRTIKVAEDIL
jgi:hypothetical protein